MKRVLLTSFLLVVVGAAMAIDWEIKKSLEVQQQASIDKSTTKATPENTSTNKLMEVSNGTTAEETTLEERKIGPDVVETIRSRGEAYVVVALKKLLSMQATQGDLQTIKKEIANLQDKVLSALDSEDFSLTKKYEVIPAFSGKLLSEAGLAKLAANPDVVKIDLDVGGGGGLRDQDQ